MERSLHRAILGVATAVVLCCPLLAYAWLDPAQPGVVTVLDSEDNRLSSVYDPTNQMEWELNFGGSTYSRIKGSQDLMALKFDLSAYRGRTVEAAELHLARRAVDSVVSLCVSTINADWHEGSGNGSRTVGAACWRWRVTPADSNNYTIDNEWTYQRSDFSTAAFGNFGSLVSYGFAADDTFKSYSGPGTSYGWIGMKLDPAVVQALILDQYGLTVTDARWHSGSSGPNPAVYTKEQNDTVRPRLYIKFAATDDVTPPLPVTNLSAQAGPDNGQVVLTFDAPTDPQAAKAFGYTVRYSQTNDFAGATDLARWRIPRPGVPGAVQRVLIEDLTPYTTYYFFVQAYDAVGNPSTVATTSLFVPAPVTATLEDVPFVTPDPTGKTIRTVANVMRWWAAPPTTGVNPVTGNRYEDGYTGSGADDYKKANVVWDSGTNTISLLAARNEVVAAQLVIEKLTAGSLTNVGVTAGNLTGPGGVTIPADTCIERFQMHYLTSGSSKCPDPAIPLASPFPATFSIPDPNHNPTGMNQSVWTDIYVPTGSVPGDYTGTLTVTADQLSSPVTVNLKIHVSPVTIPDMPTFLVDLNGYGDPWNWGSSNAQDDRIALRYFQACHKHRVVPNCLPYSHLNGNVQTDRIPDVMTGSGATLHAASWSTFDRRYGPLFDGSAFSPTNPVQPYYGPGENTPITHFYSTFHESWPIYILDAALGFDAEGLGPAYWYSLNPSDLVTMFTNLPDVYSAFPEGYKQGLRNVMADWVQHAHDMGWTQTAFETYHNEKFSDHWGSPAVYDPVFWVMEENDSADDFRADGFYHELWREGYEQANCPDVKWHFRIDISTRYGLNYGQLDNRINYWDLSASSASWWWPQIKYRSYNLDADKPEQWVDYSDSPSPAQSGVVWPQLFLRRWSQGLAGVLPYWDAFGYASWTSFGSPASVIYSGRSVPGMSTPYEGCLLSMRVKQMRQAEQLIELLNLWADTDGMNRQRVRDAIFAKYGTATASSDYYSYPNIDDVTLYHMKANLLAKIEASTILEGDINNDGYVNVGDLQELAAAWAGHAAPPASANWNAAADLNTDGYVNVGDLQVLVAHWGRHR